MEVPGSEVRLRWHRVAGEGEAARVAESAWELSSEPDWSRLKAIRLIAAVFDDGGALGVAAIRPRDARGHGDDAVAARFLDPDGIRVATSEALVSVEYDSARVPRRLGIELWPDADSAPLRIAADRESRLEPPAADAREVLAMTFRLDGVAGRGTYETLRPS